MKCLVTGAAGFIGSRLAEALVARGNQVVGIDAFTPYYSPELKEANLAGLRYSRGFTLIRGHLLDLYLLPLLQGVDVVFHEAGQAGVRASWGAEFSSYIRDNVLSTQALLKAAKNSSVKRIVYASSSSVYGEAKSLPVKETDLPQPLSPYGVTKLAAEHLCHLYWQNHGVPVVSLRYFTVYGPHQRPDMAFHRFIKALLQDEEITLNEDGNQSRDFTYIADAVEATLRAGERPEIEGQVMNVAGGNPVTINHVLALLEEATGTKPHLRLNPHQRGDVRHTYADGSLAQGWLDYSP